MVENNAVVAQTIHQGEVKSPRMVQTDNAFSAALVQPLQEVQPMAAQSMAARSTSKGAVQSQGPPSLALQAATVQRKNLRQYRR